MASTTSLYTAFSGLNANARSLDVIGNNIANVNTTAFKSSRLNFANALGRTMREGSPPQDTTGGTNPFQIGLGVVVAGTQRNMQAGTISATGDARDLAIDGPGFFVVRRGEDSFYTRDGAFRLNSQNQMTTIRGDRVMGYPVDADFNILDGGELSPITIPLNQLTVVEPTTTVRMGGNLNATGPLATGGSLIALTSGSLAGFVDVTGQPLALTTPLTQIEDPQAPASGLPLFAAGQTLQLRNVEKGGRLLPPAELEVGAGTTLTELADFLTRALGIDTTTGANPDGRTPGVTLDPATGALQITGNTGVRNDVSLEASDLRLMNADGTVARFPFAPQRSATADGESVRTTFIAFDTLGTPVELDITFTLEQRSDAGTSWRYFIESADATGIDLRVGSGVASFDNEGRLIEGSPIAVTLSRENSGAATPLTFEINLGGPEETFTALSDVRSSVAATFRDGAPIGTLTNYAVDADGVILGSFTNGLVRSLGQIPLATFTNPEGLVDTGAGVYAVGANSGAPAVAAPGLLGSGTIASGALELSNVDIGEEFIKLILSSTGYSASSRVIRTADELMQQLLVLGR